MRSLPALVLVLATVGCEGSPSRPSTTTPPPSNTDAPVARIEVAIDELGSRDAIVALSQVAVDARASTGSGPLTYATDFGDGTTANDAVSRHVYDRPGTFTITTNVRDSAGRTASASRQVVVKTLTGRWFHAGYIQRAHQFELRSLTITSQEGLVVRGSFRGQDQIERPFTGRLTSPRSVQIALDDQSGQLEGVAPGSLNEDGQLWTFQMRGGSVDGERLGFRPVLAEPTGPPPDAVLKIRFDSFGAERPIQALSPIQFDGSASRGDGLSYLIEFGDGEFSTEPTVTHPIDRTGQIWTRLTVVDRFGRTDAEVTRYFVTSLIDPLHGSWLSYVPGEGMMELKFTARHGLNLTGHLAHGGFPNNSVPIQSPFTATLSGERDIHIVVDGLGIQFRGHIELTLELGGEMILVQTGGADHGRTRTFIFDDF